MMDVLLIVLLGLFILGLTASPRRRKPTGRPSDGLEFSGSPERVELLKTIYDVTAANSPINWWGRDFLPALWRFERDNNERLVRFTEDRLRLISALDMTISVLSDQPETADMYAEQRRGDAIRLARRVLSEMAGRPERGR